MKITIVTTMRNEAPHLLEWIAHHRAAGVTDVLIYSNDCEDGTDDLLDVLASAGVVHHIRQQTSEKPPQWRALKAAWDHTAVAEADWVSCIDCDEFVRLGNGLRDLPQLISCVDADAILLPWRLFGNNGHIALDTAATIQRFTRAAPEVLLYPAIGSYFKTLFRRNGPFRQLGVHRPRQKDAEKHGAPRWVDGSGRPAPDGLANMDSRIMNWNQPADRDLVQLNHYSVRSAADFMIKRARGLPNHVKKKIDLTYWVERNFNAVEDTSISPMWTGDPGGIGEADAN